MLAMLLLALPLASASHELTGAAVAPLTTLAIEARVPEYSRDATLDVAGRTKPLATVHAFVNNVRQRVVTTRADGLFMLANLPLGAGTNALKLEAHEGTAVVTKEFTVTYDGTPPVVTLDKELPKATTAQSLTVSGDVNERVTIYYRVLHRKDTAAPGLTTGLKAGKIEANAVELVWDPNTAADTREYLIERNGKRIAVTPLTSFRDEHLKPNTAHSYAVSAVDNSCNIGVSAELAATTRLGGTNVTPAQPPAINLSCETPYLTATAGSPFSLTLALAQGINDIEIIFEDLAGNREIIRQQILSDIVGPKFIDTNLEESTPAYAPDITIKGRLDEQATVFVYVNDETKPSEFEVTDADGSFSIRTHLRTDVRIKRGATKAGIETGDGWVNKIKLEAIDLAGNKAAYGPVDIDFLLCGSGAWWNARIDEPSPATLLPRLMLQGVQQINIPFNLSYIGTQQNVKIGKIDVRPIPLAAQAKEDYDHDWVQVQEHVLPRGPKSRVGNVMIQFENVNPLPDKPEAGANEKELALSGHRRGECLVPGTGCVKLFLQMEIQFQEVIPLAPTDPSMPISTPSIEKKTQRICMPVEVAIDQVIPTDVIPKNLIRNLLSIVDGGIALVDKVLKPLTTIGEYVLYGCLASNLWLYVSLAEEKWHCTVTPYKDAIFQQGGWNPAVAEAGLCDAIYGPKEGATQSDSDANKQQACKQCQGKIESRKKFRENVRNPLCDRIGCPSAPAFATYIKGKAGRAVPMKVDGIEEKADLLKWALPGKDGKLTLFSGNDCAFTVKEANYITPTYSGRSAFAISRQVREAAAFTPEGEEAPAVHEAFEATLGAAPDMLGIRALYDIAKGTDVPLKASQEPSPEDCKQILHPAHPKCCGIQYQRDWSSACGPGTSVGSALDIFDELKESTCLAAQQANIPAPDLNCNRLWNSIAGFCEKNTGQPTFQPVNLEAFWKDREGKPRPSADGNQGFLFVFPVEPGQPSTLGLPTAQIGLGGTGTARAYQVWAGYVQSGYASAPTSGIAGALGGYPPKVSVGETKATESLIDVTECFGQKPQEGAPRMELQAQINCAYNKVCKEMKEQDAPYELAPCEQGNIRRAVEKVNQVVMTPDTQYIVKPNSGFLRSIECACIPAVTSYLHMWQRVLGALHKCFSKVLLTGEGSEGACAAALSAPICDLLFEFISCFVQKFDAAGSGSRAETEGFGNILGVLTGAGSDLSKDVTERYGDTPLYKSLFSERKLVHAICSWAFTGTWDLNIETLFQQQVDEMPVETQAILTTCERTFNGYDPTTSPSGLTTWAYRIAGGGIAGADIQYRLKLKCSEGFGCDPGDYADGKCDCFTQSRSVYVNDPGLGAGRARKYDVIDFDVPFLIQAQRTPDSEVRYDTAILEWTWTDKQNKQVQTKSVECKIRETEGGHALPFCAVDVFSGKFRCLFGEQESGIRILSAGTAYPEKQDAFGLNQHINFSLNIKQQYPPERSSQQAAQKFLTYEIKDTRGETVKRADGVPLKLEPDALSDKYALGTDGTYTFLVPQSPDETPLAQFTLKEDIIRKHSLAAAAAVPSQQTWPITVSGLVTKTLVSTPAGLASSEKMWFLIVFPKFSESVKGEESYEIYRVTPPGSKFPAKDPTFGWNNVPKSALAVFAGKQSPDKPTNVASFTLGVNGAPVTIEFKKLTGYTAKEIQILAEYSPPAEQPKGQTACDTKQPVRWSAVFTVYDADRSGNPTEQISTDPETGEQQQKIIDVYVRCMTPEQIKAEVEAAAGVKPNATAAGKKCAELGGVCGTMPITLCGGEGKTPFFTASDCPDFCCSAAGMAAPAPSAPTTAALDATLVGTALTVTEVGTNNRYYLEKNRLGNWEEIGIYTPDGQWYVPPQNLRGPERFSSEVLDFFRGSTEWNYVPPAKDVLDMKPVGHYVIIQDGTFFLKLQKQANQNWKRVANKIGNAAAFSALPAEEQQEELPQTMMRVSALGNEIWVFTSS
jgi:hypothetical protein